MYSMIEPDVLLPEQFNSAGHLTNLQPERRLMLAVLEDAIQTVMRHGGDRRPRQRKLVRDVERWLDPRHDEGIFSFNSICTVLDLDGESIRRGVRRMIYGLEAGKQNRSRLAFARRMAGERHRVSVARGYRSQATRAVA